MHVKKTEARFFTMVIFAIALWSVTSAETRVGGILNGTNRWVPESGPYIIESDLVIARSAELVIYAGTRIVIAEGKGADQTLPQLDRLDSESVAVKVNGSLICKGKKSKRIVFVPAGTGEGRLGWYGIIFDRARSSSCQVEYCDVTGAYNGITVKGCSPLIRGCVLEQNNVGLNCRTDGAALLFNCIVANNFSAGIRVNGATPHIANSIIVYNKNNGVWCENGSKFKFEYNCVFGNGDGNLLDCDPLLGHYTKKIGKKDSADYAGNLYCDPVFFGTPADSVGFARDLKQPTDKSLIKKVSLALIVEDTLQDSSFAQYKAREYPRFTLSKYSPCVNTGDPDAVFKDANGTRNDRGIFGGPKKIERPAQ